MIIKYISIIKYNLNYVVSGLILIKKIWKIFGRWKFHFRKVKDKKSSIFESVSTYIVSAIFYIESCYAIQMWRADELCGVEDKWWG